MIFIVFVLLFLLYFFISYRLFLESSYIHSNLLFFAEKALIALQTSLSLENIGFVYPPAAFAPFLVVNNPIFVPTLMSSILSTLLIVYLLKFYEVNTYYLLALTFFFLNPIYLFLASQRLDVLMFYIVLTLSVFYTLKHLETGYSIYIFISGFLLGLTFFIDFRSLFIVPLYAIIVLTSTSNGSISYKLAILTVKITPIVFFFLSWLYLNWIFTENPFNFIESPYSFFRSEQVPEEFMSVSGSFLLSFIIILKYFAFNMPIFFPYFLVFFTLRRYRMFFSIPLFLVYTIPIFLLYLSTYFGLFFPYVYTSILFLIFAILFASQTGFSRTPLFLVSMFLSFLFSFVLPSYSKDLNEKAFVDFIRGGSIPQFLQKEEDMKVAQLLKEIGCKKILSDDAYTFPVVYFKGDVKNFILPYNYGFYSAVSNPLIFADCLLISNSPRDILNKRFPKAQKGFVDGFYLYYDGERYKIYTRRNM